MRKIEKQMLAAVKAKQDWAGGNTTVLYSPLNKISQVFLHGKHIATHHHDDGSLFVNTATLAAWPTNVTKSRLRALGAKVTTVKGETFLDGVKVC